MATPFKTCDAASCTAWLGSGPFFSLLLILTWCQVTLNLRGHAFATCPASHESCTTLPGIRLLQLYIAAHLSCTVAAMGAARRAVAGLLRKAASTTRTGSTAEASLASPLARLGNCATSPAAFVPRRTFLTGESVLQQPRVVTVWSLMGMSCTSLNSMAQQLLMRSCQTI